MVVANFLAITFLIFIYLLFYDMALSQLKICKFFFSVRRQWNRWQVAVIFFYDFDTFEALNVSNFSKVIIHNICFICEPHLLDWRLKGRFSKKRGWDFGVMRLINLLYCRLSNYRWHFQLARLGDDTVHRHINFFHVPWNILFESQLAFVLDFSFLTSSCKFYAELLHRFGSLRFIFGFLHI